MNLTNFEQTNQITGGEFTSLQLSFSTADIERSIFFEDENIPASPTEPFAEGNIIVVHGEMFRLEKEGVPKETTPLTKGSGLFRIVNLAKKPEL
jgi:hypothetical protein